MVIFTNNSILALNNSFLIIKSLTKVSELIIYNLWLKIWKFKYFRTLNQPLYLFTYKLKLINIPIYFNIIQESFLLHHTNWRLKPRNDQIKLKTTLNVLKEPVLRLDYTIKKNRNKRNSNSVRFKIKLF